MYCLWKLTELHKRCYVFTLLGNSKFFRKFKIGSSVGAIQQCRLRTARIDPFSLQCPSIPWLRLWKLKRSYLHFELNVGKRMSLNQSFKRVTVPTSHLPSVCSVTLESTLVCGNASSRPCVVLHRILLSQVGCALRNRALSSAWFDVSQPNSAAYCSVCVGEKSVRSIWVFVKMKAGCKAALLIECNLNQKIVLQICRSREALQIDQFFMLWC